MKFIYNQLGDWYLAMAAYDWGAGNVQRAVQKTGYADFWELTAAIICRPRPRTTSLKFWRPSSSPITPPSMGSTTSRLILLS